MENYKFQNGFSESTKKFLKKGNQRLNFIEVENNRFFMYRKVYNNSKLPCYKKIIRVQDGKIFNANMDNGIAYILTT